MGEAAGARNAAVRGVGWVEPTARARHSPRKRPACVCAPIGLGTQAPSLSNASPHTLTPPQMGYGDAPWVFTGRALYQLHLVPVTEARRHVPPEFQLVSLFG